MTDRALTSNLSTTTIAIVGSGFSGALVAANLLKTATRPLIVKLVERKHDIGKGVAYSTEVDRHLLNVSAGNMSAFLDDPTHLLRWLNYNRNELAAFLPNGVDASTFIPRKIYGLYLQSILEEAEATAFNDVRLEYLRDEVVAVEPERKGAIVTLQSDLKFWADKIVLAIGNSPATPFSNLSSNNDRIRNAWSADAVSDIEHDTSVLLIGTGLTTIDTIVSLQAHHRGKIYAVSRRGLAPLSHQATKPYPTFLTPETAPKTIRELLHRVRSEVRTAAQDYNWRAVIDSLRPIAQQLWQQLPHIEQQRFLRHVKPYWEVHRHRIAPEIDTIVQEILDSGRLVISAGRIRENQLTTDGVSVTVCDRYAKMNTVLRVSRVVNCTGVEVDYRCSAQPLITNLRSQGLIRPNQLGLGLDTTSNGAVLDTNGTVSTLLYTLGSPCKGDLWETIAVPELRGQAKRVAEAVLRSLPVRVRPIPTTLSTEQSFKSVLPQSTLVFRQFFDPESNTYTYLLADNQTQDAVLVDPVLEQVDRDLQALQDLGLTLRYCLETHIHADHITGAGKLRQQTGCQAIVPQNATARSADRSLADRETLTIGSVAIQAISTPGHTSSHLSYLVNNTHLLTGDALLIRGCGRTDFQGGDAGTLYDTVTQRLFTLPDSTLVYPAHDYKGRTVSTIGEEKRLNPRFIVRGATRSEYRTRDQFITLMNHLGLAYPEKMKEAVPANEFCGDFMPQASLEAVMRFVGAEDREKLELMLSTNAEIYNDYFAMHI
jgi:uncharacterized NAD(P)/FAD-binding protein YdhS/glyoxylase-like metal-dependent hydrolase (beta-lactamase superfamily II)